MGSMDWALYMAVGLGPSWLLGDCLFTQLATLNRSAPESLALAIYLSAVAAVANSLSVPFFYGVQRYVRWPLRQWVVVIVYVEIGACLLAAACWNRPVGGYSLALYAVIAVASFAGNLQQLALVPWLGSSVEPDKIVEVMAGGNAGAVLMAGLSYVQTLLAPLDLKFWGEPSFFFLLAALLLGCSAAALGIVIRKHDAMKRAMKEQEEKQDNPLRMLEDDERSSSLDSFVELGLEDDDEGARTRSKSVTTTSWLLMPRWEGESPQARWRCLLLTWLNAWIQLVCWILLREALPYVVKMARPRDRAAKDGRAYLSLAINLSLATCFLGALAAKRFANTIKAQSVIVGATALQTVAFIGVLGVAGAAAVLRIRTSFAPLIIIITAVAAIRAIDGFLGPLIYTQILAISKSVQVLQWAGSMAILVSVVGVWITLILSLVYQ